MAILNFILWFAFVYLSVWVVYLAAFSFAGQFFRNPKTRNTPKSGHRYLILVPVYKEDDVIIKSVRENLNVDFDKKNYQLVVIADSLQNETITVLNDFPIHVEQVSFAKSTKAKALNQALHAIDVQHFTHVIILDADNVMDSNFLQNIDSYPDHVLHAAQAHRTAKNQQSTMAFLDALNEEIGNHIFRKGHRAMGLSSALIGSAMVFETTLYKRLMAPISDTAGEDKMLEFALLEEKIKVQYLNNAIVYDEKVAKKEQFSGQRTRWVAARFYFLKHYALKALKKLLVFDIDYFNKWLQFLLPQKVLLIAYVFSFWMLSFVFTSFLVPASILLAVLMLTFALAIPKQFYSLKLLRAISAIPTMALQMFKVLIKAKQADPTSFNVTKKEAE